MTNADRRRRRIRRKSRRIAQIIAKTPEEVEEIKESRPPAAAVNKVRTVLEDGLELTDSVSVTSTTDPYFSYDDDARGYDYSEYAP